MWNDSAQIICRYLPVCARWQAALVLAVWMLPHPAPLQSAPLCEGLRPNDSVWMVSTVHVECGTRDALSRLHYYRYVPNRGWRRSSFEDYCACHPADAVTSIYVHGNRIRPELAQKRGLELYAEMAKASAPEVAVRQVVWSWPSQRIAGPIRDARAKAQRTSLESYVLASWVAQFPAESRLSMVGFSFGARIITGALHLLAGGSFDRYALPSQNLQLAPKARVVAIAAAIDSDWLHPGGCHGRACEGMDRLLVIHNPRDFVLRRFHLLRPGKQALGAEGPAGGLAPCLQGRFEAIDASTCVGCRHSWQAYIRSRGLMSRLIRHALWCDPDTGCSPGLHVGESTWKKPLRS